MGEIHLNAVTWMLWPLLMLRQGRCPQILKKNNYEVTQLRKLFKSEYLANASPNPACHQSSSEPGGLHGLVPRLELTVLNFS